jgi:hypothetical protein
VVSEPSLSHSAFAGFRFPPEIIVLAVRWYLRFGLSYRDVEELLSERGVEVDHVTVYLRVQRLALQLTEAARPCRHAVGDRWYVDETYVRVAGRWRYVYRGVDQNGQIIDVYVSAALLRCSQIGHNAGSPSGLSCVRIERDRSIPGRTNRPSDISRSSQGGAPTQCNRA